MGIDAGLYGRYDHDHDTTDLDVDIDIDIEVGAALAAREGVVRGEAL